jgi:hypothetical protein
MSGELLRRVVKHGAMLFLTTHGFSATSIDGAEPAALARTVYHVFTAWIAVTATRAGEAARVLRALPVCPRPTGTSLADGQDRPPARGRTPSTECCRIS